MGEFHKKLLVLLALLAACSSNSSSGDDAGTDTGGDTDTDTDSDTDTETETDTYPDCGLEGIRHITGTGADNVFVFGNHGTILHIEGDSWSYEEIPDANVESAWAAATGEVFAVGRADDGDEDPPPTVPVVWLRDDSGWSDLHSNDDMRLFDVWGMSASEVIAVGEKLSTGEGLVVSFDGDDWYEFICSTLNELWGVWFSSTSDVHAVSPMNFVHFDGETCLDVEVSDDPEFFPGQVDVWGSGPNDVFSVGQLDFNVWHNDGLGWSGMLPEGGEMLTAVWGAAQDDIFAVGANIIVSDGPVTVPILHHDGDSWSSDQLALGSTALGAVWGSAGDDVYVGGHDVLAHYDGTDWTQLCN
jgi:hypothetical protein